MSAPSHSQAMASSPIGDALDDFRNKFDLICKKNCTPLSSQALDQFHYIDKKYLLATLVYTLEALAAAQHLPSQSGYKSLFDDLARLHTALSSDDFDTKRVRPLLDAILNKQPDKFIWDAVYNAVTESSPPPRSTSSYQQTLWSVNTGSFVNSSEHRKYVDDVLKNELGDLYAGIPEFFEVFFGDVPGLRPAAQAVFNKCKEGESPLFQLESGWQGWPKEAKEKDVLSWLDSLIDQLLDLAKEHQPVSRAQRRMLAQPDQPLQGSTANRKLDIGFVDNPNACVDLKYHWSQILIPGELKSNPSADKQSMAWFDLCRYAREVLAAQDSRRFVLGFTLCGSLMRLWLFDRLGGIASEQFDINTDGLRFVSVIFGYLWMNKEQLGFDPTIVTVGDKQYIEVERESGKERLVIERVIKRVRCVAGRATTCWKVYREEDPNTPLVVKDSWQYPERAEEGELLREATEKGVKNVARYFHHETVRVRGQDDDIRANVRRGLDITKATNYKSEKQILPPSTNRREVSRKDGSSSVAGRKPLLSCTGSGTPPSKSTCLSSPVARAVANRVHRRVVVRDYGKAIFKASSQTNLLAAIEGCIDGYESLYKRTGILHCDISPNNLMINEDDNDPSWRAFLIDLDLAITDNREKPSGAQGKIGTRAFMAIGALLEDERHSFMYDLESFFWVLFWICIHYDGPRKGRIVPGYENWNYMDFGNLASIKKGEVVDESDFVKTAKANFTQYYQPLIPCVIRLRSKVFPNGQRWLVPNENLYVQMKEILRNERDKLKNKDLSQGGDSRA